MLKPQRPSFLATALAFCALVCASTTMAASTTESPTTQIEADALRYNEKEKLSVFTGSVKLVRGELTILGAQIDLKEFDDGRQQGVATGKPAQFERDQQSSNGSGVTEKVRGFARKITYDSANDTLLLEGDAKLQRWRDGKLSDETRGQRINYIDTTGVFTVDGGSASNPSKRVTATIGPKPAQTAP